MLQHELVREAASKLPRSPLVAPSCRPAAAAATTTPGGAQRQQDCAETFMWLVETLHAALNSCRPLPAHSLHVANMRPGDHGK